MVWVWVYALSVNVGLYEYCECGIRMYDSIYTYNNKVCFCIEWLHLFKKNFLQLKVEKLDWTKLELGSGNSSATLLIY